MLRGRTYALPEDMTDLVPDVLRHRLVLSYEALSEGLTADALVGKIMRQDPGARRSRWNMKSWLPRPPPKRPCRRAARSAAAGADAPSACCAGSSGR